MPKNDQVIRLQREVNNFKLRYARSEATQLVNSLEAEGILFGDTPQEIESEKKNQTDYFTYLLMQDGGEQDVAHEADVIRRRYKRKRPNPAAPTQTGVARFARQDVPAGGGANADDDFEDEIGQQHGFEAVNYFASLQSGPKKLSRKEAINETRRRFARQ